MTVLVSQIRDAGRRPIPPRRGNATSRSIEGARAVRCAIADAGSTERPVEPDRSSDADGIELGEPNLGLARGPGRRSGAGGRDNADDGPGDCRYVAVDVSDTRGGFLTFVIGLIADLISFNRQLIEMTLEKVRVLELEADRGREAARRAGRGEH